MSILSIGPRIMNTVKIQDMAPKTWFKDPKESSIWLTCYKAFRMPLEQLNGFHTVDLEKTRLVFLNGTLNYFEAGKPKTEIGSDGQFVMDAGQPSMKTTSQGTYVLLIAPFEVDGVENSEAETRDKIRDAIGLLANLFGRNIVFQHMFDNVIQLDGDKTTSFSQTFENPFFFPEVNFNSNGIVTLQETSTAISKLTTREKNRTYLLLRWFQYALYDPDGPSSFIKYWIAIETLAMPDTSNIRPINEALVKLYGLTVEAANQHFYVGRILNLRSKIVHDGLIVPINAHLLRYLEALYSDLFAIKLGIYCKKRAEAMLLDSACELQNFLKMG